MPPILPPKSPGSARKSATTTGNTTSRRPRRSPNPVRPARWSGSRSWRPSIPSWSRPTAPRSASATGPSKGLEPFEHRVPMLSIENTYSLDELKKYGERVAKLLPGETGRVGGGVEGRRRGRFADLRERPADPRRDPRQRPGGRRHHPQRPHDQGHSAAATVVGMAHKAGMRGSAAAVGSPRRNLHDQLRPRAAERGPAARRASRRSPTRETSPPAASANSIRESAPSGGCGSSATAPATRAG